MIQEISKNFYNQYNPCKPKDDDFVICFDGANVLLDIANGIISYPTVSEIDAEKRFLFKIGDKNFFLSNSKAFKNYQYYHYTILRTAAPSEFAFAGVTALHLNNWYRDNKYCGRCGKPMHHSESERAMICSCGNTVYPKICPAVIVAITSKGKICLTKYNRPNAHWALVAGFNEIGESIEQTVQREVMEETGLRVKNLKYYKSQPWGFTSTLLYGFYCEVDGDDTIKIDNIELKEGKWFSPLEIDFENDGLSLTREMIDVFKNNGVDY